MILPKFFEAIEFTRIGVEYVYQYVAVIEYSPSAVTNTFGASNGDAFGFDFFFYFLCQSTDVCGVFSGSDYKVIGYRRLLCDVDNFDVVRVPVFKNVCYCLC